MVKKDSENKIAVVVCKKCGRFAATLQNGKPAPLIHCECKNRTDFVRGFVPFEKTGEIKIEY